MAARAGAASGREVVSRLDGDLGTRPAPWSRPAARSTGSWGSPRAGCPASRSFEPSRSSTSGRSPARRPAGPPGAAGAGAAAPRRTGRRPRCRAGRPGRRPRTCPRAQRRLRRPVRGSRGRPRTWRPSPSSCARRCCSSRWRPRRRRRSRSATSSSASDGSRAWPAELATALAAGCSCPVCGSRRPPGARHEPRPHRQGGRGGRSHRGRVRRRAQPGRPGGRQRPPCPAACAPGACRRTQPGRVGTSGARRRGRPAAGHLGAGPAPGRPAPADRGAPAAHRHPGGAGHRHGAGRLQHAKPSTSWADAWRGRRPTSTASCVPPGRRPRRRLPHARRACLGERPGRTPATSARRPRRRTACTPARGGGGIRSTPRQPTRERRRGECRLRESRRRRRGGARRGGRRPARPPCRAVARRSQRGRAGAGLPRGGGRVRRRTDRPSPSSRRPAPAARGARRDLSAHLAAEQRLRRLTERAESWQPARGVGARPLAATPGWRPSPPWSREPARTTRCGCDSRATSWPSGCVRWSRRPTNGCAQMTDHRFALEHSEEKGAGEQRGGLSLRVRDDWSGTVRDPATLSGGETFVVSLALAARARRHRQPRGRWHGGRDTVRRRGLRGARRGDARLGDGRARRPARRRPRRGRSSATSPACGPAFRPGSRCARVTPGPRSVRWRH